MQGLDPALNLSEMSGVWFRSSLHRPMNDLGRRAGARRRLAALGLAGCLAVAACTSSSGVNTESSDKASSNTEGTSTGEPGSTEPVDSVATTEQPADTAGEAPAGTTALDAPDPDTKELSFTITTKSLPNGGKIVRIACGNTMWRNLFQRLNPKASAASIWPGSTDCNPARNTSAMNAE